MRKHLVISVPPSSAGGLQLTRTLSWNTSVTLHVNGGVGLSARDSCYWRKAQSSQVDSQLPSLISLFIFVWSISETAVVSLYMGGLIVWRPSAQPKLAADHVSLWISPPLYMRMNLQCELGRCVHHNGGGVHFSVIFSEFACTKIGESVFLAKRR